MKKLIAVISLAATLVAPSWAQNYPSKPVRILVGYTAGGASDIVARAVAQELSEMNGQPFVVENRPGVGGMLAAGQVARSAPDGYVLGLGVSGTLVTGPHLVKEKLYDATNDFAGVSILTRSPFVMVTAANSQFNSVRDVLDAARVKPSEVMFASNAQSSELAMQLLNARAGVKIGSVPYPGGAQAALDVIAGRVPIMVDTYGAQQVQIASGKLKPIGVLSRARIPQLPNVPTVAESGVAGYEAYGWTAIVAPKQTPKPVIDKLNAQLRQIMARPAVQERMAALAFESVSSSPEELDRLIKEDYAKWGKVAKDVGLQPQ